MSPVKEKKELIGLVPILGGLVVMLIAFFESRDSAFPVGRAPVFFFGGIFVLAGLVMLMNAKGRKGPVGFIPMLFGLAFILIAFFDNRESAFPAGRAPVFFAGGAFTFAGLAMLINAMENPYRTALFKATGTFLLACLALVPISILWSGSGTGFLFISILVCLSLVAIGVRATIQEFRRISKSLQRTKDGP